MTRILRHIAIFARHWLGLARGFAFLAVFALGLWGWYLVRQPADWADWSNNLFSTAQLLTLQFPDNIAPLPWQLNAARFLVPAIALFESYHLVLRAIRSPARLALLGLRRGHVIVVPGRGSTGLAMLREIRLHAVRAVAIAPDLTPLDQARMEEYRLPILSRRRLLLRRLHVYIQSHGAHECQRVAVIHYARPHPVIENHLVVFEMVREMAIARSFA